MFNSDKDDDFTAKDAKKKRDSFFTFLRNVNKEYLKSPEYKDQDGFADFVKENYGIQIHMIAGGWSHYTVDDQEKYLLTKLKGLLP